MLMSIFNGDEAERIDHLIKTNKTLKNIGSRTQVWIAFSLLLFTAWFCKKVAHFFVDYRLLWNIKKIAHLLLKNLITLSYIFLVHVRHYTTITLFHVYEIRRSTSLITEAIVFPTIQFLMSFFNILFFLDQCFNFSYFAGSAKLLLTFNMVSNNTIINTTDQQFKKSHFISISYFPTCKMFVIIVPTLSAKNKNWSLKELTYPGWFF